MDTVSLGDAEIGHTYKVTIDDCCVEAGFTSELASKNYASEEKTESFKLPDGERYLESVTFSNGVTIGGNGLGVKLEPVP